MQKKILRIMFNVNFRDHTERLYKEANILDVYQLYVYNVCLFMYKHSHKLLPRLFDNMFEIVHNVHPYPTRSNSLYVLPYCRTELRKKSIVYNGAYYFNKISNASFMKLYEIHSISCFKQNIKNALCKNLLSV